VAHLGVVALLFFIGSRNTELRHVIQPHREPRLVLRITGSAAACTESPDSGWVTQQTRNLTWELTKLGLRPRFLIRDRDAKFTAPFDCVLAAEGTEVRRTPPRTPRANSIAERWVASARREALDWLLVLNEGHLRRILKEYVEHYNRARPHRSLELRPPTGDPPLGDRDAQVVVRTMRVGCIYPPAEIQRLRLRGTKLS